MINILALPCIYSKRRKVTKMKNNVVKVKNKMSIVRRTLIISVIVALIIVSTGCSTVNSNVDKKALLVVSFGTSFVESRQVSIDATNHVLHEAFPEYDLYTAFTSEIIIDIYKNRDDVTYDTVSEAIEKIYKKKYGEVLVVPTLIINGDEYDRMIDAIRPFEDKIERLIVSDPLLTKISDYERVARAVIEELPEKTDDTAVVLMGHGTHHDANAAYPALDYTFKHMDRDDIFVGTVEGAPPFDDVAKDVADGAYEKVHLLPLMFVAGDHAHNDMAGDEEDSWKLMFKSMGYDVETTLKGLGELPAIRELFIEHAKEALMEADA